MAKKTVRIDESNDGRKMVVHQVTKAQRKSEAREIPLTPAPRTAWQKFKRAAVG